MTKQSPILDALNSESHVFLSIHAPELLDAIDAEIGRGQTPEQIYRLISRYVGPDRQALAIRALQAASYIARTQRG